MTQGNTIKNIFVLGADEFNMAQLRKLRHADRYRFHDLFRHDDVKAGPEFPVERLLEEGTRRLREFPERVDAVVGYWDFPVSTMLPLLPRPLGLPSPTFEATLKCEHIGYDDAPFNVEFYWDDAADRIALLEVNPRISKSHCPLFEKVDGVSHHQVMVDVALGRRPDFPHREGAYRFAAKFMWRVTEDALVGHVPDERELLSRYRQCRESMHLEFKPVSSGGSS